MLRRRSKNDGLDELVTILTITIFIGFFLIKWQQAIEKIVWLVCAIAGLISKAEYKKNISNITNKPFENVKIDNEEILLENIIIKNKED